MFRRRTNLGEVALGPYLKFHHDTNALREQLADPVTISRDVVPEFVSRGGLNYETGKSMTSDATVDYAEFFWFGNPKSHSYYAFRQPR